MGNVEERRRRLRAENRALLIELKSVPCADCGIRYPHYVMDFDHVRGVKAGNVSLMKAEGQAKLLAEVAKCDVVCSNCHRERTFGNKKYAARESNPQPTD